MKTITAAQRSINIISRAIAEGFEFDQNTSFEGIAGDAANYLEFEVELEADYEAEVKTGNRHLSWCDDMGYQLEVDGEFYTSEDARRYREDGKMYVHTTFDSEAKLVAFYEIF